MEDYPKNLSELEERFSSEEACREYLFALRWPDGFRCPRCDRDKAWAVGKDLFECVDCSYQASVTAGTILQGTHKPLRMWFRAIWWVTSQKTGVSALGLQRGLGLGSYPTAWTWLHKLRRAMVRPGRDRLHGLVEVDEVYVGGDRSGSRGRGAGGKALVFAAAEEVATGRIGRIRLLRIPDAAMMSLHEAVAACVAPGATVRTDGWGGYNGLDAIGYARTIARKEGIVGEDVLPLINRVASLLKRWLLGTHQGAVRPAHLDYYLDEFTFRFNRRTSRSRGKLFYRLVEQAVVCEPWTQSEIRGGCPIN